MTDDTVTAETRGLVGELETAMRAGDARAVVALYRPDAVKYDLAPPLRHTGAEVHDVAGLQSWFDGFGGSVGYEVHDLAVTAGTGVAFAYSLNKMYDPSPEGRFELWFRATYCLVRTDGRWLLAHEHTSTPFHMDGSFRAAVDLQP
jgi:ketosteroid isomerase-like protein